MQIPLLLDRSRPASLTTQIAEQLRDAILTGRIAPGARMPSSRRLAEQIDVSRNTVVRAYEWLTIEGYVEARAASGVFAAQRLPEHKQPNLAAAPTNDAGPSSPMPMPYGPMRAPDLVNQNRSRLAFDFFPGRPSAALFPLKTWRRLLQTCLSHGGAVGLSQYSDPAGLAVLRTAIASHVAAARGIVADVSRIIVVSGVQEGINIAARLFLGRGTIGIVENPCYQGARFVFEASGAQVAGVAVDQDGIRPDELPHQPASLIYVTPSHQYPTGHTLALARRHALITWARHTGCYILEDDYDGDFRYDGSPLPSVASLAPDCTIHLGTFSKSLGAGLRIGYMVVPAPLAAAARAAKALLNNGNPWLDQAALAEMIRSGSYAAHLARIRARYRESRDSLLGALRRQFGEVDVSGAGGGLHVLWRLPPGVPDAPVLERVARRARVGVYALASGGAYDAEESVLARRGIVLGYAALLPRQIEQGIARLSEAIDDALELPSSPTELVVRFAPAHRREAARPPYLAPRFLQQPALRADVSRRASSRWNGPAASDRPMPTVSTIYRYPIKGLSAQRLSSVVLQTGQPMPHDRVFALARPFSPVESYSAKWAKKGLFVMLMLDEALARVRTQFDVDSLDLTIMQGNQQVLAANLGSESGRLEVEEFYRQLVPTLNGAPRLVRAQGHFMDKPDNVLSLINLATVRSLEEQWGFEIDPLRFRANIYIDGAQPWEEFDWIGRDIVLGDALFRVDRRNGRCGATNVNPASGRRDLDIPGSLRAAFGHKDLGVYLVTRKTGEVSIGAAVTAPRSAGPLNQVPRPAVHANGQRRFICRGCYFIYEEELGLPQLSIPAGTGFAALPDAWQCPDCGTEKTNFRPHVGTG
ncbi:MAG TPA: aminotransferase class I/II-fold pyridoxal phosphate-dependent enzyme [Xanthobacteraceae bacterium]|nr:aminotransferase class I/II-fold pyridoxal phosphate-dependent enzyme [Xanthobacteraceae bacterium]